MQAVFLPTVTSTCLCKSFWLGCATRSGSCRDQNGKKTNTPVPSVSVATAKSGRQRHLGHGPARSLFGHETRVTCQSENGWKTGKYEVLGPGNYRERRLWRQASVRESPISLEETDSHEKRGAEEGLHDSGENENPYFCLELRSQDRRLTSVLPNSLCWLYKSRHFTRSRCR